MNKTSIAEFGMRISEFVFQNKKPFLFISFRNPHSAIRIRVY